MNNVETFPRTDEKRGWSTQCRRGDCASCAVAGARCSHGCHGLGGQTPPTIKRAEPMGRPRNNPLPDDFAWEDPPEGRRGGKAWTLDPLVETELRQHPKRWARVGTYRSKSGASTMARKIGKGETPLKAEYWEARGRIVDNHSALYLRFLGDA